MPFSYFYLSPLLLHCYSFLLFSTFIFLTILLLNLQLLYLRKASNLEHKHPLALGTCIISSIIFFLYYCIANYILFRHLVFLKFYVFLLPSIIRLYPDLKIQMLALIFLRGDNVSLVHSTYFLI